jgi:hypothetical protein
MNPCPAAVAESHLFSWIFGFMGLNGGKVFLGRAIFRLNFERILETNNGLIQPVETHQHHPEVQMTWEMAGIDFEHGGVFADGLIGLVGGH